MPLPSNCQFAFLLKTYAGDAGYVDRLLASYHKHNQEGIPLIISCPAADRSLFEHFTTDSVSVINDEDVTDELVDVEVRGIRPGYINQEIVKLAFWETRIARNYMCLDSDGLFLRDFYVADFMFDDETPYTVMFEDNELRTDPDYYDLYWRSREQLLNRIRDEVGLPEQPILTCHGFGIFSSAVLRALRKSFMVPRGLSYSRLLAISPYEFSWYTLFLQADHTIGIHPRESLFRYIHTPRQYHLMTLAGTTTTDLARGYVGVVVNSNFSRDFGIAEIGNPLHEVMARFVSFGDLARAIFGRFRLGIRVLPRWLVRRVRSAIGRR